ncbi:hypothetical protein A6A19_07705 [Actinobacillus delphinicola]|uniref:Uncharacterized protein n=1 Tax=Actinobacillus delphinicola TaxID=51161 RepID=A0A448TTP3_9PAST|nr:hypothetical protein [Actinobacillus delphinicola]MDG6897859.1 hypothetical protein [Actinobacillus delphinicola]VEJ09370.1 Uncharacterised protein [Actinobacillus delphinicola]
MKEKDMLENLEIENEAEWTGEMESHDCSKCDEILIFTLRDNFHTFTIPFSTVLAMLKFAETDGDIPPIPPEWWVRMQGLYPTLPTPVANP